MLVPMMTTQLSPVQMWRAVAARDRRADGRFVYAVATTGIYCRPWCPSRRPRPDRVSYFENPAAAERAGFRACLRCHPGRPEFTDPWAERIQTACELLAGQDGETRVELGPLARRIGTSPFHFQRNFKRLVGLTPRQYAEASRLGKVKRQLRGTGDVTEAMLEAGYRSSSRFYERAVPRLGMTPSTYKRGGAGATIRFATVRSAIGVVLVAATPRGVCAVTIGSSARDLHAALVREYPLATIERDASGELAVATGRILAHIDGREPGLDLPLDIHATAFQWRVWNALAQIPYGETRSYRDVAAAIGEPRAARAVARACAANRAALAIPCHRVVTAGGGPGGYRWGSRRKRALLAREQSRRAT
jgi:AraC family transcriptional regulator of adaptative response/methylated-DNA-[protein]-cysteine methyltransferase